MEVTINLKKRHLYLFVGMIVVVALGILVVAQTAPNPGHSADRIAFGTNLVDTGIQISRAGGSPYVLFIRDGEGVGQIRGQAPDRISITDEDGSTDFLSVNTETGNVGIGTVPAVDAKLHVKGGARGLRLEGIDHVFIEYYPDGFAAGRKAWIGFGGGESDNFGIANQISGGGLILSTANNAGNICLNGVCKVDWSSAGGTITGVTAGAGLTGGGTSGTVTLNIGAADGIDVFSDTILVDVTDILGIGLRETNNDIGVYSLMARDGFPINALYVDNVGNVGIGTTNPGAKLDVAGSFRASSADIGGNLFVGGSVFPSGNVVVGGDVAVGGSLSLPTNTCVVRSSSGFNRKEFFDNPCNSGEILMGGGGECTTSTLQKSYPEGATGSEPIGWTVECDTTSSEIRIRAVCCSF